MQSLGQTEADRRAGLRPGKARVRVQIAFREGTEPLRHPSGVLLKVADPGAPRTLSLADYTVFRTDGQNEVTLDLYEEDVAALEARVESDSEAVEDATRRHQRALKRFVAQAYPEETLDLDEFVEWPEPVAKYAARYTGSVAKEYLAETGRDLRPLASVEVLESLGFAQSRDTTLVSLALRDILADLVPAEAPRKGK